MLLFVFGLVRWYIVLVPLKYILAFVCSNRLVNLRINGLLSRFLYL
jgi:hypothetical protein